MRTVVALVIVLALARSPARAEDPPPAVNPPVAAADWTAQCGDVPFVIGAEPGREEVKLTGLPAMFFFTSDADACSAFAKKAWSDKEIVETVSGYTAVLVRASDAPQDLKDKFLNVPLPVVAWVDFKERRIFVHHGEDVEALRTAAGKAAARRPEPYAPAAKFVPVLEWRKKLEAAAQSKDVRAQLEAIAEIRKLGIGVAVQAFAAAADVRLVKEGEAELERAKALFAEQKVGEAKEAAEKLVAVYGAEHPVGQKAKTFLVGLAPKPKKKP